jgi:electron transport complex protein RnfE
VSVRHDEAAAPPVSQTFLTGLWHNNPGLVQLLGICPLLAITNTVVNGIGLGLATLFVFCISNTFISLARHWIPESVRLPAYVMIIASIVTVAEQLCKAFFFDLYLALGIFLPLIITNCTILGRAEAFASKQPVGAALVDGIGHGLGFAAVLAVIGATREILGHGTILAGSEQLFGSAGGLAISGNGGETDVLRIALIPAGAFFVLAALVAVRNAVADRSRRRAPASSATS